MTGHALKIHEQPFNDLLSGAKTCEVRNNDRGFQVGDTVLLHEIADTFTGRVMVRKITHVQTGYGLPDGLCVLSYAQLPSQGGEAVAWAICKEPGRVDWLSATYANKRAAEEHVASYKDGLTLYITPLYTHPADQVAQPDAEMVELLREARELIEHGDFREGHCMCGSAVEAHGFGDGHSPVDAGVYYAGQVMERIDAKLASLWVKP